MRQLSMQEKIGTVKLISKQIAFITRHKFQIGTRDLKNLLQESALRKRVKKGWDLLWDF